MPRLAGSEHPADTGLESIMLQMSVLHNTGC